MRRLSANLRSIYLLEISLGNSVQRIDEPAGTKCPLAVVFEDPLHFEEAENLGLVSSNVKRWKNVDPHYPLEAGYLCRKTNHALAGPSTAV